MPLLQGLMTPGCPADVHEEALKCLCSWVEFGIALNDGEEVYNQVFVALQDPNLFDTAVDVLVNVFSHADSHR